MPSHKTDCDYEYRQIEHLKATIADLLEALEKIRTACYSGGQYKISQVDAIATQAIAKAKGE